MVHFNLHINYRRLRIDAADLYYILLTDIRSVDTSALAGLAVDESSVQIQGNNSIFYSLHITTISNCFLISDWIGYHGNTIITNQVTEKLKHLSKGDGMISLIYYLK